MSFQKACLFASFHSSDKLLDKATHTPGTVCDRTANICKKKKRKEKKKKKRHHFICTLQQLYISNDPLMIRGLLA